MPNVWNWPISDLATAKLSDRSAPYAVEKVAVVGSVERCSLFAILEYVPSPPVNTVGLMVIFGVASFVSNYISLHCMRLNVADPGEKVRTDGITEMEESDREWDELTQRWDKEEQERIAREEPDWVCESCGEANAHSFGSCWKCSREKPSVS